MQEVLDELDAEVDAEIASAPLSAQVEEALRNPKLPAMQVHAAGRRCASGSGGRHDDDTGS